MPTHTYDDSAIKGEQLLKTLTAVASDIAAKQDALDVELDVPNKRIVLNNVAFTVNTGD
jgi:hypothetical protein